MDLSRVRFSVWAVTIGALLFLLSLGSAIRLGTYEYALVENVWARFLLGGLGLALVILGAYIEYRDKVMESDKRSTKDQEGYGEHALTEYMPNKFFYTLDDKRALGFSQMVAGATRVRVLSRTAVNLLSQYSRDFENLGLRECKIELLFVDPNSAVARYLYGDNPEIYQSNIKTAAHHLHKLKQKIGDKIEVRVTPHPPTFSLIIVEKEYSQDSFMQVQLYFLHGAIGRDRPLFRIPYSDPWYRIFYGEFERIWKSSVMWNVEQFIHGGVGSWPTDCQ